MGEVFIMKALKLLFSVLKWGEPQLWGSQIFSFLTIFFNIALLATSAWLIATAGLHPPIEALGLAIVGVRFYGISRAVVRYGERYLSHDMAFQGLYALRTWMYKTIEPLTPALFEKYRTGDLLNRLMGDIEILQFFYLRVLIPPVTAIFITLLFGWYVSLFSTMYLLLLILAFVLAGIVIPAGVLLYTSKLSNGLMAQRSLGKEDITETLNGILDIVAYNARDAVTSRLQRTFAKSDALKVAIGAGNAVGGAAFIGTVQLTMIGALWIGGSLWYGNSAHGVYIAVLAIAFQAYFEALQPMTEAFHAGKDSYSAAQRLLDIYETVPAVQEEPTTAGVHQQLNSPVVVAQTNGEQRPLIVFSNIHFSYGTQPVFRDFSLTIYEGEKVAIVGPSGSGKTTLISLLERFYEYSSGSIKLQGKELQDTSAEWTRAQFGTMTQNPYIFHATLEENIRLAKPTATEEEIRRACHLSELDGVIEALPQGAQTMIGSGGRHLSGGERQRVALARMYLSDRPILLLDEPLEQLDQITRHHIRNSLRMAMKDATVLLITHQIKDLNTMDRIVFLEHGIIRESGTYDELISAKGEFYEYLRLSDAI